MGGLNAAILPLSFVKEDNEKFRLDSGYFDRNALHSVGLLNGKLTETLGSVCSTLRKGIFDIKADTYVEEDDGIPFVRIGDMKGGLIEAGSTAWISNEAHAKEAKTRLRFGDIAISKTAYAAASFINLSDCNVSQDVIAVKLSKAGESTFKSGYVTSYLNCSIGLPIMQRYFQGNVQQHLSLDDAKKIRVPNLSIGLQTRIDSVVRRAILERDSASSFGKAAEQTLLAALNLADWLPPQPLTFTASSALYLTAGRIDAQYFSPKFDEMHARLKSVGGELSLEDALTVNSRGRQPRYADIGLPVINSKHVRTNNVLLGEGNRLAVEEGSPVFVEPGDVLVNGTGVGTIGRAAPYMHSVRALPDNHVTVLRPKTLDPIFLSVFLNSQLGQMQIERFISGSSGQIELYPSDIGKILVWDAPTAVQMEIRGAVLSEFEQNHSARKFVDCAKRAVEIAIEDSEAAAIAYLDSVGA